MKFIESDCVPNISHLTIDLLIAKAVNNPKNEFYIDLGRDPKAISYSINTFLNVSLTFKEECFGSLKEELNKYKKLPKNLKLKIELFRYYFKN